uniref:SET and MYND domain-containing protein 4 n=1 Tax=Culex tarsalis TaxID=7177 RepID=A0A1Q3EWL8_CULTA
MINAPESVTASSQQMMRERPLIILRGQLERLRPNLAPDASLAKFTRAIEQCHLLDQLPATSGTGGKCSRKATKLRAEGNRLYLAKDYRKALWKYNESICLAETGSEHLAMGYANRSAIYFEQNEFEYALANIALAKQHHYPERLMPKLIEREQKCRAKLAEGLSKGTDPPLEFELNVPVNPKIPFLASGIKMVRLEDFGRSMVATESFKTGDVILHEKSILASIDLMAQFQNCNLCAAEEEYSLIPCPNCATVMYCSQECLERDFRLVHRFECPIAEKVQHLSFGFSNLGPKLFLYGLSLFDDDLDEMMRYCHKRTKTGGNPLNLDYTRYDPLEEFKELYNLSATTTPTNEFSYRFFTTIRCLVLLESPLLESIVVSDEQKAFMRQCVLDFTRAASYYKWDRTSPLFPVQSLFNHSCDPNVLIAIRSAHVKLVVFQPIRPNEQICFSYGHRWWETPMCKEPFQMVFVCKCVICDPLKNVAWQAKKRAITAAANRDLVFVSHAVCGARSNNVTDLGLIQTFIERHGHIVHARKEYGALLDLHWKLLFNLLTEEDEAQRRSKVMAALEGGVTNDVD